MITAEQERDALKLALEQQLTLNGTLLVDVVRVVADWIDDGDEQDADEAMQRIETVLCIEVAAELTRRGKATIAAAAFATARARIAELERVLAAARDVSALHDQGEVAASLLEKLANTVSAADGENE